MDFRDVRADHFLIAESVQAATSAFKSLIDLNTRSRARHISLIVVEFECTISIAPVRALNDSHASY